jgi:hypothetical protein
MKVYLTSLMLLMSITLISQNRLPNIATNPNSTATSLTYLEDTPVSRFTGRAYYSIPLFELEGREVTIPFNLDYNSQGLKPLVPHGWTGYDWTLNAGGVITRVTKKHIDEQLLRGKKYGYFYNKDSLNRANWYNLLNSSNSDSVSRKKLDSLDFEADEFYFNFLNHSGKFYLNHLGEWCVQSDNQYKVIFDTTDFFNPNTYFNISSWNNRNVSRAFKKFTIIDNVGNKYIFGDDYNAIEYSSDMGDIDGSTLMASSWRLSKIISTNGIDTINFYYERGPFEPYVYKFANKVVTDSYAWIDKTWLIRGSFSSSVYLDSIKNNLGGKVVFYNSISSNYKYSRSNVLEVLFDKYNQMSNWQYFLPLLITSVPISKYTTVYGDQLDRLGWLKLNSIYFYTPKGNIDKSVSLTYSAQMYLSNLTINYNRTNLYMPPYLNNNSISQFNFSYIKTDSIPYLNYETITDHWGFYNGRSFPSDLALINANRAVDTMKVKYGLLDTIYLPQGGKVAFKYEANDYRAYIDRFNNDQLVLDGWPAGGVRIKKITEYFIDGHTASREFFYKKNYITDPYPISSGILYSKPLYYRAFTDLTDINNNTAWYSLWQSLPVFPLSEKESGSHITYSEVTECQKNDNNIVGYTVYKYSNFDNGYANDVLYRNNVSLNLYFPSTSYAYKRGRLLEKSEYTNSKKIVRKTINTWTTLSGSNYSSNNLSVDLLKIRDLYNYKSYYSSSIGYNNVNAPFVLQNQKIYLYDSLGVDSTLRQISYEYNTDKQVTKIDEVLSNGNTRSKTIKYPQDYVAGVSSTGASNDFLTLKNMYTKNMIDFPVEETDKMTISGNTYVIGGKLNMYGNFANKYYLKSQYKLKINLPVLNSSFTPFRFSGTTPNQSMVYDSRYEFLTRLNYNANYATITEQTFNDSTKTSYIWSYNYLYPIAVIENAKYANVVYAVGGASELQRLEKTYLADYEIPYLHKKLQSTQLLKNANISTSIYKPFVGVNKITNTRGLSAYFEYDRQGRVAAERDHSKNIVSRNQYHTQNTNDLEELSELTQDPQTRTVFCTAGTGGSVSGVERIFLYGTLVNLNQLFTPSAGSEYLFDGYYINNVKISQPDVYYLTGNDTVQARFSLRPEDMPISIHFGDSQLSDNYFVDYEIMDSGFTTLYSGTLNMQETSQFSNTISSSIFPIYVKLTVRTTIPSFRVTIDGNCVYENWSTVPYGTSFTSDLLYSSNHEIIIENP